MLISKKIRSYSVKVGLGNNANITVTALAGSEKATGSNSTKTFKVTADMSSAVFTYTNPAVGETNHDDLVYDGIAKTLNVENFSATLGGVAFTDFEIDADGYKNNINQGTATVTLKGKDNYDGRVEKTFTITKRPITLNAKDGKRAYGEPNTKIVEATSGAGLVDYTASDLATGQSVKAVISTSVAQNANVAENAGAISLDQTSTKILDADGNDVTSNYTITWGTTAAKLTIVQQSILSEDVELTFTPSKQYDGTATIPTYTFKDTNLNYTLQQGNAEDNKDFLVTTAAGTSADLKAAGTYTIQFTGKGNYTADKYASPQTVTISQKPITIKAADKSIGTGETPVYSAEDYSAGVIGEDNLGTITYKVYTTDDTSYGTEKDPSTLDPGTYVIHPSGLTNANYAYTYQDGTLTISATQIFAKPTVADVTFGTEIADPTLKHFDGLAEAKVSDFESNVGATGLTYKIYDEQGNEAQKVKNYAGTELNFYPAGEYTIKASGTATYTGYDVVVLDGKFTVKPLALNDSKVTVASDITREYTGAADIPVLEDKVVFKYGSNDTDTLRLHAGTDFNAAVVSKTGNTTHDNINVASTDATVKLTAVENSNYTGATAEKTFAITRASLTISAKSKTWGYGTAEPTYEVEVQGLVGKDKNFDLTTAKQTGFSGILKVRNTAGTTMGVKAGALQPYFDNNGAVVEATGTTGSANYTITRNNADLTVEKTDIYLKVKDVQKEYGTAFAADGFVLDEDKTTAELLDDYKNNINSFLSNTTITVAAAEKYNVGIEYVVTGTAEATNFNVKEVANGKFTLTPHAITVKTVDQNVDLSATPAQAFNKVASVEGGSATVEITSGELKNSDPITALISALSATQNVGENIISIVAAENANYALTPTNTGKLTITGAASITLGADPENDAATIAQYAAGEPQVNVKLDMNNRVMKYVNAETGADGTKFEWKAQTWFALVLPFKISVADLSKAFGYAVVNRLNSVSETEVATGGKKAETNFRLEMDSIPANEPFLLKTAKKVTEINAPTAGGIIDFGAQKIVAGTPSVTKDGYTFYGTYTEKTVTKAQTKWSYLINGEWRKLGETSTNKYVISPFNAYFDRGEANAPEMVFNVQDIDGTTTSIKLLSADEVRTNNDVDGWYNLNGVKLQGAPAEKGIYIQNGKKVVIK